MVYFVVHVLYLLMIIESIASLVMVFSCSLRVSSFTQCVVLNLVLIRKFLWHCLHSNAIFWWWNVESYICVARCRTTVQTDFGCRLKYKIKKLTFLYVKILEYNIIQNQESVELIDMRCLLLQSQSTLMVEEHESWSQLSSYMFWSLFDPSKPTIHL